MSTFRYSLAAVTAAVTLAVTPQAATASETTAVTDADFAPEVVNNFSSLSSLSSLSSSSSNGGHSYTPSAPSYTPPAPKPAPKPHVPAPTNPKPAPSTDPAFDPGNPPAPATPRNANAINQGDIVITDQGKMCTIGYVDKARGVAYTAHHCAGPGYNHARTASVYKNSVTSRIGEMVYPHEYLPQVGFIEKHKIDVLADTEKDVVAIKLDSGVQAGDNIYSGNTMVPMNKVHDGDAACFYGYATGSAECGTVVSVVEQDVHRIYLKLPGGHTSQRGDSGGVMYIPGRGAIGIVKGQWNDPVKGWAGVAATGF